MNENANKIDFNYDNKPNNVRNKFITRDDPSVNVPGYWLIPHKKSDVIDNESELIARSFNSRDKLQVKLNDTISPDNYQLSYSVNKSDCPGEIPNFYYTNKDVGAGRGFGNLNISNQIRFSDQSRRDTKEYREVKEGEQMFEYQFQYLDRNYQDPKHLVMSIPRGGESTRKQNQLSVSAIRKIESMDDYDERMKTIKFNY